MKTLLVVFLLCSSAALAQIAAGFDTEVQFNRDGLLAGDPFFSWLHPAPPGTAKLALHGDLKHSTILEIHNNYAVGIDLYTHSNANWRSPYINFYKSRGTQTAPRPVLYTGYELDSIGGINFSGWDGAAYGVGAALYSQSDENWSPTAHGAHLAMYATLPGQPTQHQVMQFGGVDAQGHGSGWNIIAYAPITFGGNSAVTSGIFPVNSSGGTTPPAYLALRSGDNSRDVGLTALYVSARTINETESHTPTSSSDTCTAGQLAWDSNFVYVCVATDTWKRSALSSW